MEIRISILLTFIFVLNMKLISSFVNYPQEFGGDLRNTLIETFGYDFSENLFVAGDSQTEDSLDRIKFMMYSAASASGWTWYKEFTTSDNPIAVDVAFQASSSHVACLFSTTLLFIFSAVDGQTILAQQLAG